MPDTNARVRAALADALQGRPVDPAPTLTEVTAFFRTAPGPTPAPQREAAALTLEALRLMNQAAIMIETARTLNAGLSPVMRRHLAAAWPRCDAEMRALIGGAA